MIDHESRIPKPGDYFVFEFGRGDSVIVLRDQAGEMKAFHNVCRHRGSRLCQHGFDDPASKDARLPTGRCNSDRRAAIRRCSGVRITRGPTSWTAADLGAERDARLLRLLAERAASRPPANRGRVHLRQPLAHEPPDFESSSIGRGRRWRTVCQDYGTAKLKIAARQHYPTKANWKLVMENFLECYHCGPAHKSLVKAHPFWDGTMSAEQHQRLAKELERFVPTKYRQPDSQRGVGSGAGMIEAFRRGHPQYRVCHRIARRQTGRAAPADEKGYRTTGGRRARRGRWGTSSATTTTSRSCATHRAAS